MDKPSYDLLYPHVAAKIERRLARVDREAILAKSLGGDLSTPIYEEWNPGRPNYLPSGVPTEVTVGRSFPEQGTYTVGVRCTDYWETGAYTESWSDTVEVFE